MWHWYVRKPNEVLIDLDNRRGEFDRVGSAGRRLRAIAGEGVNVRDIWFYPSTTEEHFHLIVRLKNDIDTLEALMLAVYLRSDIFRALNTYMRFTHNVSAPDLLIADHVWPDFYRNPDVGCNCTSKHDHKTMMNCLAAKSLRGADAAEEFYPKPSDKKVKWNFGKVKL